MKKNDTSRLSGLAAEMRNTHSYTNTRTHGQTDTTHGQMDI